MEFVIVETSLLRDKYHDKGVDHRRKNNDGTKCIIHKSLMDELMESIGEEVPKVEIPQEEPVQRPLTLRAAPLMMAKSEISVPKEYPFPIIDGDSIDSMPEFCQL